MLPNIITPAKAESSAKTDQKQACGDWTAADFNLLKSAYTVEEAVLILPVGRTMLNAYIRTGELEIMKFGRRTAIPTKSLVAWLNTHRTTTKKKEG